MLTLVCSTVLILYFDFQYDTDILLLNISQYRYHSDMQMIHTFITHFVVLRVEKSDCTAFYRSDYFSDARYRTDIQCQYQIGKVRLVCYKIRVFLPLILLPVVVQYVFKSEAHGFRTVHEELAKGMTFDLKSNEHSAVKNVLKVRPPGLTLTLPLQGHLSL